MVSGMTGHLDGAKDAAMSGPVDIWIHNIKPAVALDCLCKNVCRLVGGGGVQTPISAVDEANSRSSSPFGVRADDSEHDCENGKKHDECDSVQQRALVKRFLSKREPSISLNDYLLRLDHYCPMSTAVYLATSFYITRMVAVDRLLSIHPLNVHRLVLAGLRVATKALEDLSYPHRRFAKVGGVSERELSRLEISFCFLADFELHVDAQMLAREMKALQLVADAGPAAACLGLPVLENSLGLATPESVPEGKDGIF